MTTRLIAAVVGAIALAAPATLAGNQRAARHDATTILQRLLGVSLLG